MAIAARCTEREDAARKVERTVRKSVAAALSVDRIGDRFTAIVTGASEKGTYVRVLRPPLEGRVVRGQQGLDVGDTVRVKLIGADPAKGFIDFEGPASDVGRKIARSRQKKAAAARLSRRVGRQFAAVVTAAAPKGTWVRLLTEVAEGRVVRGHHALQVGRPCASRSSPSIPCTASSISSTAPGWDSRKSERTARKKAAAWRLRGRIGESFAGVVTGSSPRATYVRIEEPEAEGAASCAVAPASPSARPCASSCSPPIPSADTSTSRETRIAERTGGRPGSLGDGDGSRPSPSPSPSLR